MKIRITTRNKRISIIKTKECTNKASIKDTKYLSQAFEWGKQKKVTNFAIFTIIKEI
jgi:hypothetical protein